MTDLGAIRIDRGTTAVEVGYLALILRRYQFGSERQADGGPALCQTDVVIGDTLIPHALAAGEVVTDRTVEVFLIDQQLVANGREVILYQMAKDSPSGCCTYATIIIILVVIVAVCRLSEVARQHIVCLLVGLLGRSINQQVRRLVAVGDALEAILVEQRLIEEINSGGGEPLTLDRGCTVYRYDRRSRWPSYSDRPDADCRRRGS